MKQQSKKLRIGCASAFWGDTDTATKQLLDEGNVDYIVYDFLAEITMALLAKLRLRDDKLGYIPDFLSHILKPNLNQIAKQKVKIISNAGGMNVIACQKALQGLLDKQGLSLKVVAVTGDDLPISTVALIEQGYIDKTTAKLLPDTFLSCNAYLGAAPIVRALELDADIIITGRCVDSAVTLAPLIYEFGWADNDYDLLAAGCLAGHIIECGTQCTGGNFTDWRCVNGFENMGFPIVECKDNGDFIVTKPKNTGGVVNFGTVAEQLVYEIGNPADYKLPDVTCDFSDVSLTEEATDRVLVSGAKGRAPTDTYKVCATFSKGYKSQAVFVIGGQDATVKGELVAKSILKKSLARLTSCGLESFERTNIELLGSDSMYGDTAYRDITREVVVKLTVTHCHKGALEMFAREIAQAATAMTPGLVNLIGGRPDVTPLVKLCSFYAPKDKLKIYCHTQDNKQKVDNVNIDLDDNASATYSSLVTLKANGTLLDDSDKTAVPLIWLAWARSGDKGDDANIGVIARHPKYLPYIVNALDENRIGELFSHVGLSAISIWSMPGINAINILLSQALDGGGVSSTRIDAQGKAFAQMLLETTIDIPNDFLQDQLLTKRMSYA